MSRDNQYEDCTFAMVLPRITQIHPSPRPLPPHPNPVSVKADVEGTRPPEPQLRRNWATCSPLAPRVRPINPGRRHRLLLCPDVRRDASTSSNRFAGYTRTKHPSPWPPAGLPRWSRGRQLPQRRARTEHVKRMGMPKVCVFTSIARPLRALGFRLRFATP
jgi:hypothetical protein